MLLLICYYNVVRIVLFVWTNMSLDPLLVNSIVVISFMKTVCVVGSSSKPLVHYVNMKLRLMMLIMKNVVKKE